MSIKIRLEGDVEVRAKFEQLSSGGRLANALIVKMTELMTRLQQKIRSGKLAAHNKTGEVSDSIRNPRAEQEGTSIVGKLDWGGVYAYYMGKTPLTGGVRIYDVAQILNYGAEAHPIGALTEAGTRLHEKGMKRRFGSNVLAFEWEKTGKREFFRHVWHPGVKGIHFMEEALEEMKGEFTKGVNQVLEDTVVKKGRI